MQGLVETRKRKDGDFLPDEWSYVEHSLMKRILICEKNIERFSAVDLSVSGFAYASAAMKGAMMEIGARMEVVFTKEALRWLCGEEMIGPWCPFWYKWKNEAFWDDSRNGWNLPEWRPDRLAAVMLLADGCDNCMNWCAEKGCGKCLCGVRENIDDLPYWEKFACSHFIADDQEYPDLGSDTGIEEETMSENHRRNWKERGCPVYGPEESRLPVADTPCGRFPSGGGYAAETHHPRSAEDIGVRAIRG